MANRLTEVIDRAGVVASESSIAAESRDQSNRTFRVPENCVRFQQVKLAVGVERRAIAGCADSLAVVADTVDHPVRVAGPGWECLDAAAAPDHRREPAYGASL